MYTAIAKVMVRSSRMRNFPAHIPTSQSQTLPPQRREPASASTTQIDILYLSFILSDFFDFMRILEVRELSFHFLFPCFSHIRHFFYASFRRVGRFRFRGFQKVQGLGQTRFMGKILSNEVQQEDFSHNRLRLDLVCPWRTRNYLCRWERKWLSRRFRISILWRMHY